MNIQEAIKHAWNKSGDCNAERAEEHGQLALWLEELVALRRQVGELKKEKHETFTFLNQENDKLNLQVADLLKERDELRARAGIAEKALGLACGWLAEEKLQGCSANHPLVLKAKDQMKHGALSQAKATE